MQEFDTGKQVDGADVGKAVANIISQLGMGDKGQPQKQSSSGVTKLVPTGPGLASLSKKLVDRIVSGQYIDFSELPPAKGRTRSLPNAEEGHIVIIRAEDLAGSKKMIPDLATWLQCFCIYAAVITEHEPARTKSLLAYATIIAKASLKYAWPSWVVYPPGSGRQCKQGLGKGGPKHIHTMFYQRGNQHRGLVQVLPISGPQLRNVPDESISEH